MSEHASPGGWRWIGRVLLTGGLGAGAYFYFQRDEVKFGITDGMVTEVLSDLPEGAQIITGISSSNSTAGSRPPAGNPFGGGMRRF